MGGILAATSVLSGLFNQHPADKDRIAEAQRLLPLAVQGDLISAQIILHEKDLSATAVGRSAYATAWSQVQGSNPGVYQAALQAGPLADSDYKNQAGHGPKVGATTFSTALVPPPPTSSQSTLGAIGKQLLGAVQTDAGHAISQAGTAISGGGAPAVPSAGIPATLSTSSPLTWAIAGVALLILVLVLRRS